MTTPPDHNPLDAMRRSVDDTSRIDRAVADRIESQLRIAHAGQNQTAGRRWWRPAVAAPVLLVIVLALSIALVLRSSDPAVALVVTDADNVTVRLPDGSVVVDPNDGFELPDGAIVEIEPGGMVTVDDVVLDSAGRLEVRDGRLVADVVATTTTPERPDHLAPPPQSADSVTTTGPPPTTSTEPPVTTVAPKASEEPATTSTSVPSTRDDDRGGRDGGGADDRGDGRGTDDGDARDRDRDAEPAEDSDGDTAGPGWDDGAEGLTVGISLEIERADDGIRLVWNVDGLQPGWTVVVVRTAEDRDPVVVTSSGASQGEIIDQPTREDGRRADRRVRYSLSVLDAAGGEVASGPSQSLR